MQQIPLDRFHLPQTAAVTVVTVAALALLGYVAAYWTWNWLAPRPEPRVQPAAQAPDSASAGTLFGSAQRNSAAPSGSAIKLLGIVAAAGSRSGYAVVQLEPRLILAVPEGQDVVPGLRLAEVGADHIILERNGAREILAWPDKGTAADPAALRAAK